MPIVCSDKGPMSEILGDAGVYFDPEKPTEIADVLKKLINSPMIREQKVNVAYKIAKAYTW